MGKSFRKDFFYYFLALLLIVFSLSLLTWLINKSRFERQTAETITSTVNILDESISLYKDLLRERFSRVNDQMLDSHRLVEKFVQESANPSEWDILKIKQDLQKKIGGDIEINLIDNKNTIYLTTYPEELGLDLGKFPDAMAGIEETRESGKIRMDIPTFEPAGKVFRAYSMSYIKSKKIFVQLGYKLSDYADFHRILQKSIESARILSAVDLYLVFKEKTGQLSVHSFTDFSEKFPDTIVKNVLNAVADNTLVKTDYKLSGRHFRDFYKVFSKEGIHDSWYNGIEHYLVYRLKLDLTSYDKHLAVYLYLSLGMLFIMAAIITYIYFRFDRTFAAPLRKVIEKMERSESIDPLKISGSYNEITSISETYNQHLKTIIEDHEQLNLYNEELINKNILLQQSLDEIKTLRGILPLCSHCRQIRNDEGYWQKVEEYFQHNLDIRFSHGICPDCAKKFYPDIGNRIF